jgi:tetratricopeptide repeat protein 21B
MVEAHVLAALINCESGNTKAAESSLHQAFAQDFKIRENPVFMLMRSEVEMKQSDWLNAAKTLEQAYDLPGVKDAALPTDNRQPAGKKYSLPFGQEERARIFINLVMCYCEVKNFDAAKRILSRAVGEFSGTPEEVRVMLA